MYVHFDLIRSILVVRQARIPDMNNLSMSQVHVPIMMARKAEFPGPLLPTWINFNLGLDK